MGEEFTDSGSMIVGSGSGGPTVQEILAALRDAGISMKLVATRQGCKVTLISRSWEAFTAIDTSGEVESEIRFFANSPLDRHHVLELLRVLTEGLPQAFTALRDSLAMPGGLRGTTIPNDPRLGHWTIPSLDVGRRRVLPSSQDNNLSRETHLGSFHHAIDASRLFEFYEIRRVRLHNLRGLRHLWKRGMRYIHFPNLRILRVDKCNRLRDLFPVSVARGFVHLEWLKVTNCEKMKTIVSPEKGQYGNVGDKIEFPKLKYLELVNLPRLTNFCIGIEGVDFPQLVEMHIKSLQQLRCFCSAMDSSLIKEDDSGLACNILFDEKAAFPSLEILQLCDLDNMNQIWHCSPTNRFFAELKVLVVVYCGNMANLLSHAMAKVLLDLRQLIVEDCLKMQEIIVNNHSRGQMENEILFPQLKRLELIKLPRLQTFCYIDSSLKLPLLEQVVICSCPNMVTFSKGLLLTPKLKHMRRDESMFRFADINDVIQRRSNKKVTHESESSSFTRPSECSGTTIQKGSTVAEVNGSNLWAREMPMDKEKVSCILYCAMFHCEYEVSKVTLIWLWIAVGLITENGTERMEDTGSRYFDDMLKLKYLVPSGYDHYANQVKYKVDHAAISHIERQYASAGYTWDLDKSPDVSKSVHLSISSKEIDPTTFESLKKCTYLQTLLFLYLGGPKVKHLPHDLFLDLISLRVLDLSHSGITDLPCSISIVKSLCYLDMSETPIRRLPESMGSLINLQTLRLAGCLSLTALPKCITRLTNLRHLILDVARQLNSLPSGIGKLTRLQTLSTFIVGKEDGNGIGELMNMNNLTGSLHLLKLENVSSKEDASSAALHNKLYIRKLELQWGDKTEIVEEVLECLRPHPSLEELEILFYTGKMLPSWLGDPSFTKISKISLYNCMYCDSLPALGELPSLKCLSIVEMNGVQNIDSLLGEPQKGRTHGSFPSLEKLKFDVMLNLEECTGVQYGDFPCLQQLTIQYCPKLLSLSFLSHLLSLKHLEVRYCPELLSFPEDGLPTSVQILMVKDCAKLQQKYCSDTSEEWIKIAHVPTIYINDQKFRD